MSYLALTKLETKGTELAELLLDFGAQVLVDRPLDAVLLEQLNALFEGQLDYGDLALEGRELELLVDGLQLLGEALLEVVEEVREQLAEELQYFEVVLLDGHLQIETDELAHVSVGERVFSPEDGADLEDPLEVTHNTHLLVELRRLRQAGRLAEVLEVEYVRASF